MTPITPIAPEIGHIHRAPGWAEYVLKSTAVVGMLWITVFLLRTLWLTTENGQFPVELRDMSLGAAAWMISVVMLWRQYQLRKWACALAALVAWLTIPILWFMRLSGDPMQLTATLLLVAGSALVALILTSACITGWKELQEGF